MWTSHKIRETFIRFFEQKGHRVVPGCSVVPAHDPTLMFVNAGMNQFKDVFLGQGTRSYCRAVNSQLCVRVSGKHNDLEDVGYDATHLTSFEMLGNWSFGDYYKKEAIAWAWELLTQDFQIDKTHLLVTVYEKDDEAYQLWASETDIDPTRILRCDEKDNFWEMGETGPCGPCSEIYVDLTPDLQREGDLTQSDLDSGRFIELWNLVFIQYNRHENGDFSVLPETHVDTGAGLERLTAYLQQTPSNYETDLFKPIIRQIETITGIPYVDAGIGGTEEGMAHRVIADHVRTICFGIADTIMPSNEGRGYVLRRLLRRALRYVQKLDYEGPILYQLVPVVIETMGGHFVHLKSSKLLIQTVIKSEEESFLQTLALGLGRIDVLLSQLKSSDSLVISGEDAFKLYDTYGFPIDLTQMIARERGVDVDRAGYDRYLLMQKTMSREQTKLKLARDVDDGEGVIDNELFSALPLHLSIYTDRARGGEARLITDPVEKMDMARHHSATHLLHAALRHYLGDHVQQAGSLVDTDRLRFDFTHFDSISDTMIHDIEGWVNHHIQLALEVTITSMTLDEAKEAGAMALFGEKYDSDRVRIVSMGGGSTEVCSIELCGGTHVNNTALVEQFKIISESAISAGTRRIEAVAGTSYIETHNHAQKEKWIDKIVTYHCKLNRKEYHLDPLDEISADLELPYIDRNETELRTVLASDTVQQLKFVFDQYVRYSKQVEKNVSQLKSQRAGQLLDQVASEIEWIVDSDYALLSKDLPEYDMKMLKELSDRLINKHPNLIMLLGGRSGNQGIYVVKLPESAIERVGNAGKISQKIGRIAGGNGGGRSSFASGGGADGDKLADALNQVKEKILQRVR